MNPAVQEFRIRRMTVADLDQVIEIAQSLKQAPQWPRKVYEAAVGGEATPKRIALVAHDPALGTVTALPLPVLRLRRLSWKRSWSRPHFSGLG